MMYILQVQGYPTLLLFKDGEKVEEYNSGRDITALSDFITKHVGHDEL